MHREEPVGDGRSCRNRRNLQPLAYTHTRIRAEGEGKKKLKKKKKKEGKKKRVKNKRGVEQSPLAASFPLSTYTGVSKINPK